MPQNIELSEENDLQALVINQFPESKTLDYKEYLPGNSDSDKKEFLADVSSFANASGGYLIYGMRENSGFASELCGLESIDVDAEILRLENIIRDGIKPRIPGVSLRVIHLQTSSKDVIIIFSPMSWASPHMVSFKNDSKFYSRNSRGKYQLDVSELRTAFVLSETTTERIRNFRIERLSKIIAGETPVRLNPSPKIILHIIPFGAFNPSSRFDVSSLATERGRLQPISAGCWDSRHNFDGYVSFANSLTYLQVFRNGIIEAVDASIIESVDRTLTIPTIPSLLFERELIEALPRFLSVQRQLGVEPPLFILLSLLGVSGYRMGVNSRFDTYPIDRDTLILPEIIVENFECNPSEVMKPIFDAIWNAAGWPRSMNYEAGERVRR